MHVALLSVDWLIALLWVVSTLQALRNLPRIPDLLDARFGLPREKSETPEISVIVPAKNEEEAVEAALRTLLAVEGLTIEIVAVNDRSTDATGAIMDRVAAEATAAGRLMRVVHIEALPEGWMGKTHAMACAARQASGRWLLFTDADIFYTPDSLLRAVNFAEGRVAKEHEADHLVVFPTLILKSFGERMMIAVFQGIAALSSRFWKIPDPKAKESIGVGAFNMVRADVYRAMGGFEALRLEVLEDLRFGVEVKRQGYRQRVAFGKGMVRVRWAVGLAGMVRNITKNFFAVFRFTVWITVLACAGMTAFCVGPFAAASLGHALVWPAVTVLLMLFLLYRYYRRYTGIATWYCVTFPIGLCVMVYSILRSMVVTLSRGGVQWRGTFYPLAELKKHAGPVR
ncbi:glycosyltransferase [Silvibacterium sp.]|uniref:glycosyltransferase n=1 Tax=Silvibacterium sp. TaxID=1964179 RepID=UPI0039E3F47D